MLSCVKKIDFPHLCLTPCSNFCISRSFFSIRSHAVISDIFPTKRGVGKSIIICFSINSIYVSPRQPLSQITAQMIIECCHSCYGVTLPLWVINGHPAMAEECPLCPQKRTLAADFMRPRPSSTLLQQIADFGE